MRAFTLVRTLFLIEMVWCATLEVGSGKTFTTIADAYAKAIEGDTIMISPGTYNEKLTIDKDNITMKGSTSPSMDPAGNMVTITAATYAKDVKDNDASATLLITANNFSLYNINVANTAGNDSQAVALSTKGTSCGFYACSITGYQDTLYAHDGSSFFGSCYVEGAVDFVFGIMGQAWLQGCKVAVLKKKGTVTAQGRTSGGTGGEIVFDRAKITTGPTAASSAKGTNFLGRPLGDFSQTVFQNSDLGGVIAPAGWEVFRDGQDTSKVLAAEFQNTNADGTRVGFASMLDAEVKIEAVLPGYENWVDMRFVGVSAP
ncbi:pectin methylesterase [Rhexocercosporidium sp. MPI-PUGE-AT-0058]|nr:pectin methylesterase [Rhexocercosporidium sp. MPI-PUGE-AT-0058]